MNNQENSTVQTENFWQQREEVSRVVTTDAAAKIHDCFYNHMETRVAYKVQEKSCVRIVVTGNRLEH